MSPLREFRAWTTRYEEEIKIEPLRRYYLIFEGANTERKYFQGIEDCRKELGINSYIELVILHKEGEIRSFSHPSKLLEWVISNYNEKPIPKTSLATALSYVDLNPDDVNIHDIQDKVLMQRHVSRNC
jgi:hypothetical protein